MSDYQPGRNAGLVGALVLGLGVAGCGGGRTPDPSPAVGVQLWVEPEQMAGPDTWMKFTWDSDNATEIVETNFGNMTLFPISSPLPLDGSMVAYISLQNREATQAHYTIKVRNSSGEQEAVVYVPVGAAENAAPHVEMINAVSGVSILSGEDASEAVHFDASQSWDEQDGATGLEARWDFDGDGEYDTDWDADLDIEHAYTRAEALSVPVYTDPLNPDQVQIDDRYTVHNMVVTMTLRDSAGLETDHIVEIHVAVYD